MSDVEWLMLFAAVGGVSVLFTLLHIARTLTLINDRLIDLVQRFTPDDEDDE